MRKKILLSDIEKAINNDINLEIDNNKIISANELLVIKRDGRIEKYDINKMKKICLWACDNNETFANDILKSTRIKLYNKIKIQDVYDEIIKSTVNKISRLTPQYEKIAAKLYLLKIYKETWNIKKTDYIDFVNVIEKGLSKNVYNKKVFKSYSIDEIKELGKYIQQERDFLFTYKSLYIFFEKYSMGISKTKKFELPQHTYMRIAMSLFYQENPEIRLNLVKDFYDVISQHYITVATPIMLNAGSKNQQLSSCVLSTVGDDTISIMDVAKDVGIYSKNKGGTAIDISRIRCSGSSILGNDGYSTGPVPFVKIYESTVKAFNQGSSRPGACCIYFQWWNYNVRELVVLKNNGGTEENRARQLKYAVKINQLLIDRYLNGENVTLFDPKEASELFGKTGEEFNKKYCELENKTNIKKIVIPAKQLFALIFKERAETGNIYLFHEENVNNASLLNRYINSSNLCCEIVLPSRESKLIKQINYIDDGKEMLCKQYEIGEIALCNLSSINIFKFMQANEEMRNKVIKYIIRGLDNSIDVSYYPVKEAELSNKKYRYLGIGVLNMANYLANKKIVIDSQEALEETHKIFDEISFHIIEESMKLAIEKGAFPCFKETLWAKGELPIFKANKNALKLTDYQPNLDKWKKLANMVKQYGLRNAQLLAIAPTATSGKAINATESIEPIQNLYYKEDGKTNLPTLVPNIKNWKYYKLAHECDQYMLLKAAAIRQCYLDQAQSINIYFNQIKSLKDFSLIHIWGFSLGIKTFYYCKTLKEDIENICESCS